MTTGEFARVMRMTWKNVRAWIAYGVIRRSINPSGRILIQCAASHRLTVPEEVKETLPCLRHRARIRPPTISGERLLVLEFLPKLRKWWRECRV